MWFAIPGSHFVAAAAGLRASVPRSELPSCAQALAHKLLLPSLAACAGAALPVSRATQRAGDLVITAPGAVQCV